MNIDFMQTVNQWINDGIAQTNYGKGIFSKLRKKANVRYENKTRLEPKGWQMSPSQRPKFWKVFLCFAQRVFADVLY